MKKKQRVNKETVSKVLLYWSCVQYMSSIRHIGPMMALLALCGAVDQQ